MNQIITQLMNRAAVLLSMLAIVVAVGVTTGCKEKGPAEKAGADLDKAVGDVKEAAKETADDVKEAADDAAKEVKKAADEATK